jgi:pimeloyl-ACP methyl ester carboxylesterase
MRPIPLAAAFAALSVVAYPLSAAPLMDKTVAVSPEVTLHVIEAGAGSKAPIVFIPGWSAGAGIWRAQIDRFDKDRRVIAFDPRSQGDSTKTTSGNTPEQRAVDLHKLLAAEHVIHPVLVGWSQAAQDVAAYVSLYGTGDLAGIVLVDAAVSDGAKGIAARPDDAATQFGRFSTYLTDQRAYLRGMFGAIVSKPQPPGMIDRAIATAMKTPPSTGLSMLVADMFGTDRTAALAKIDCPTLIIAAGSSQELARQKAEATIIRDARFVQIDDSAHAVFLDQPDRFAAALEDFLRQMESR